MRGFGIVVAASAGIVALEAQATALSIVQADSHELHCVFSPQCKHVGDDTSDSITLPGLNTAGTAFVQSRIWAGAAGSPGEGKRAYVYRVDMTQASGNVDCVAGMVVNFGPHVPMPYKGGKLADIFVMTSGGLGTVGLKSAEKTGDVIDFQFEQALCVGETGKSAKNTTFFFGLAAAALPQKITAKIYKTGNPPFVDVVLRVPVHAPPPGGGPDL